VGRNEAGASAGLATGGSNPPSQTQTDVRGSVCLHTSGEDELDACGGGVGLPLPTAMQARGADSGLGIDSAAWPVGGGVQWCASVMISSSDGRPSGASACQTEPQA
jgi:hypothetical protein